MNSKVFLIKHVPSGILFADDGLTFVFTSKEAAIAEVQFLGDNLDDVEFIETDDLPDSALLWHSLDCYMIINGLVHNDNGASWSVRDTTQPMDYTVEQFKADLEQPYAWPGGYPRYFVTFDGEALSFEAAKANQTIIAFEIAEQSKCDWRVVGCEINLEDNELYCAHTGNKIESAYGEDN